MNVYLGKGIREGGRREGEDRVVYIYICFLCLKVFLFWFFIMLNFYDKIYFYKVYYSILRINWIMNNLVGSVDYFLFRVS